MNIKTGLELFKSVWLIEDNSGLSYMETFELMLKADHAFNFRQQVEGEKVKPLEVAKMLQASEKVTYAPVDLWSDSAQTFTGFEGAKVAIIPVEGALMKADYCGYAGTATLLSFFRLAEQAKSVEKIILLIDSPGGTVNGTEPFAQAVAASQKYVHAVVTGMCCSAAYWIASGANEISATANTDMIGSIGTKVSFYDRTQYMEKMGIILREFTADASSDKGKDFNEASKGNGKLIVKSLLNPLNDEFLASVKTSRGEKINAEEVLSGKVFTSKVALKHGLIDNIKTLETILLATKESKQNKPFAMKDFKLVLQAAGVAAVYQEGAFFGLTEEQLEKVEALLSQQSQTMADMSAAATAAATAATAATERINTLTANVETLTAENTELKAKAVPPTPFVKTANDEPAPVSTVGQTSVDKWFASLK